MAHILQADDHALHACILYESLHKKPAKDAYKKMIKVLPRVKFSDFEFWYTRFLNGNYDLKHDRSTDPSLGEMPVDVIEKIVGKLDLPDRMIVRKVCRGLRSIVDKKRTTNNRIGLYFSTKFNQIRFEKLVADYSAQAQKRGFKTRGFLKHCSYGYEIKSVTAVNHQELIRNDLSTHLFNPNYEFASFEIDIDSENKQAQMKEAEDLARINHFMSYLGGTKLPVKKFILRSSTLAPMLHILPCLRDDLLNGIEIFCDNILQHNLNNVIRLDNWRNIKELRIWKLPAWVPIQILFHVEKLTVDNMKITEERLVRMRDVLFQTTHPVSYKLSYTAPEPPRWMRDEDPHIEELVDELYRVMEATSTFDDMRYNVPNSDQCFDLNVDRDDKFVVLKIDKYTRTPAPPQ